MTTAEMRAELEGLVPQLNEASLRRVLDDARKLTRTAGQAPPWLVLAPASSLLRLVGIVSLGGDALDDSEALYDGD